MAISPFPGIVKADIPADKSCINRRAMQTVFVRHAAILAGGNSPCGDMGNSFLNDIPAAGKVPHRRHREPVSGR